MNVINWFKSLFSNKDILNSQPNDSDAELDAEIDELFAEPTVKQSLYYFFSHSALRDAFFSNHPELSKSLRSFHHESSPFPLLHFWSKAEFIYTQTDGVDFDALEEIEGGDAWPPFDEVKVDVFEKNNFNLYVVSLPKPDMPSLTYFIGMLKLNDDPMTYMEESEGGQYFTLEHTSNNTTPVLCQWIHEEHITHGECNAKSSKEFSDVVFSFIEE